MSIPEPIATGNLAKTPLPHLLIYLEQKRLSGTLAIWPDDAGDAPTGQDRILLLKGRPVAGRLLHKTETLRDGLLTLFARRSAPYAFYDTNLLGDDRVSGRVDPLALIAESLRNTAREDVVDAVLARFEGAPLQLLPSAELGRYQLKSEERALVQLLRQAPLDVPTLIAQAGLPPERARRVIYLLAISKAIAPASGQARSSQPAAAGPSGAPRQPSAAPAARVPSMPAAARVPSAAPAARVPSMPAAARASGAPSAIVVEPAAPIAPATPAAPVSSVAPAAPAGGPGEGALHASLERLNHVPPPPDTLDDQLRERWLAVVARGRLIENQNYFEMLDIKREAKADEARTKFYQLAKTWHPDRQPPELAPLREYVQIIFSYMSEAHQHLGDEEKRTKYIQTLREGGGTPAADKLMQSILDMAMEYERVLVLERKRQYDAALEILTRILLVVKDDPDYHAMYAWLLLQSTQGERGTLDRIIESCDAALELYEDHERANLIKAKLLRKAGKQGEALAYFKKVADINPHNIEAVREVRVATMRSQGSKLKPKGKGKGKGDDDGGVGGLIGKFFKKK